MVHRSANLRAEQTKVSPFDQVHTFLEHVVLLRDPFDVLPAHLPLTLSMLDRKVDLVCRCSMYLTHPLFPPLSPTTSSPPWLITALLLPTPALLHDLNVLGRTAKALNQILLSCADRRNRRTGICLTDFIAHDTYPASDL
jgi:hypothetical protein